MNLLRVTVFISIACITTDLVSAAKKKVTEKRLSALGTAVDQLNDGLEEINSTVQEIKEDVHGCENGWIEHGDRCYYFSLEEEIVSWPNALLQCRAKGGYLAELEGQLENRFVGKQVQFLGSAATSGSSNTGCRDSFLTGANQIPDSALTASSMYDANYSPNRGRLNTQREGQKHGCWAARTNDQEQWIQADLQRPVKVTGVITQGRHDYHDQWVKTFVVHYSSDCTNWLPITGPSCSEKIFTGNSDRDTTITNIFPVAVTARCIRINPREWNGHVSMRFDVLGCPLERQDEIPYISLWIGGTDVLKEHEFIWATSGNIIPNEKFHDCHPSQPDNAGNSEHCLMMNYMSAWHDAACSKLSRYVCEKDKK